MIPGVFTLTELQQAIAAAPDQWRPLVFTNGCFDLLHAGHVRYLQVAKTFGKALVVGLNSDRSIQTIKQPIQRAIAATQSTVTCHLPRPLTPAAQRAEVLAALKAVDGVVLFEESTATALIETLQPEVYVKGGDYQIATLPEAATVQAYGGQVQLVQIEVPTSTTGIINRILDSIEFQSHG